jgi:hypothetical protein
MLIYFFGIKSGNKQTEEFSTFEMFFDLHQQNKSEGER